MTHEPGDELWSAIADPSRRRVLDLLVRGGEATASALALGLPFTRQAVTEHLAVLEEAGLVIRRRVGGEVRYRVDPLRIVQATRATAHVATDWDRTLRTIKRLAESAHRAAGNGARRWPAP